MTIDEVISEVGKLSPKDGDMIVLRRNEYIVPQNLRDEINVRMRAALDKLGLSKAHLLFVTMNDDIALLNEAEMEKHGWVRKREQRGREFI
jgi:hypothetical protein